jgi:hypothetical protein
MQRDGNEYGRENRRQKGSDIPSVDVRGLLEQGSNSPSVQFVVSWRLELLESYTGRPTLSSL